MSSNKPNKTIEEVFRNQFEDFELTPGKSFWPRLSRKLRLREFLRFNYRKFNVYYAGVITVATVSLLAINPKESDSITLSVSSEPLEQKELIVETPQVHMEVSSESSKGSVSASGKVSSVSRDESNRPEVDIPEIGAGDLVIAEPAIEYENTIDPDKLVRAAPFADFTIDALQGCVPLKVTFNNLSSNYDSLVWEFGDGGYTDINDPEWIFDEAGTYEIKLIIFGSDRKIAESKQSIEVYPLPEAHFEISAVDPMIPDEQLVFYNYSENSISWRWDFGDGEISNDYEPVHTYQSTNSYSVKLIAVSAMGCKDSLVITNAFGANSCYLKFPNAFIQNNGGPTGGYYSSRTDMEDEIFHPVWSGVTEYNLRIYTRSGVLVFETSDINIGWDGYYRGQKADPSVYIWKVRGVFKNGDPFVQGGDVTLVPRK